MKTENGANRNPPQRRARRNPRNSQTTPLEISIAAKPQPLISESHKLVAMWTPKVGCTFLVKWFFKSPGQLNEPRNMPVHKYRQSVYYPSEQYQAALSDYRKQPTAYRHIKLVRNPYERSVSSFIQFLKMAENNPEAFTRFLGITSVPANFEFSYSEYLEMLGKKNISTCNPHWRRQFHPLEEQQHLDFRYARLSESISFLKQVEKEFDLPRSPANYLQSQRNQKHHTKPKRLASGFVGDTKFDSQSVKAMPDYKHFYNQELLDEVRSIYRKDFHSYKFDAALESEDGPLT